MDAMGLDATVDAYDAGEVVAVDVATNETGLFIGQKGETIDAIQYLVNVAVYRDRPFVKRIVVDSEGYRQRRVEAIQGMAHRTARRAIREKRPLSLPPMSAAERRVVHLFLKENPKVTTSSEGKEEERRVVVSPV
jgi:spoIIIJ-associated protein